MERRKLDGLARRLGQLIREDAQAYERLVKAQRQEKGLLQARRRAIQCPVRICEETAEASAQMKSLIRWTGPYLGSDVRAGRALLKGAFEAAFATTAVNLQGSHPGPWDLAIQKRLIRLRAEME